MKPLTVLAILVLCITAIGVRYQFLSSHFTHTDDLFPAVTILNMPEDSAEFTERIQRKMEKEGFNPPELLLNVIETSAPIIRPLAIAYQYADMTSAAPGQFVLTSMLVKQDQDFKEILYWLRFPSFLFAVLSLIILLRLYREFFRDDELPYALVGISLISFSWMHIIYSIYSGPYAIGILAVLLTFLLFFKVLSKSNISKRESLILGISLSILMFMNYQFILFIPCFYLGLLHAKEWSLLKFFKSYLISIATIAISFLVLYFRILSKKMAHSVGFPWFTEGYIFDPPSENILEVFRYFIEFFVKNIYLVFKSLVGFTNFELLILTLFTIMCILLSLTGLVSLARSCIPKERSFGIFLLSLLGVWFCFIILQRISLSPTRHSLILLSTILIYIPVGLKFFIAKILNNNRYSKYIVCFAFVSIVIISFSLDYRHTYTERSDKFDEINIQNLTESYDLSHIYTYGWTRHLGLKKYVRENFNNIPSLGIGPFSPYNYVNKRSMKSMNVLFISHRAIRINNEIIEGFYESNNININGNPKLILKKEITSSTEFGYSNLTSNGTNSLYYYIYRISEN